MRYYTHMIEKIPPIFGKGEDMLNDLNRRFSRRVLCVGKETYEVPDPEALEKAAQELRDAGLENGTEECPYSVSTLLQIAQQGRVLLEAQEMPGIAGADVAGARDSEYNRAHAAYKKIQQLTRREPNGEKQ